MKLHHYDTFHQVISLDPTIEAESMLCGPLEDGAPLPPWLFECEHVCIVMHKKVKIGKAGKTQEFDKISGTFWALIPKGKTVEDNPNPSKLVDKILWSDGNFYGPPPDDTSQFFTDLTAVKPIVKKNDVMR